MSIPEQNQGLITPEPEKTDHIHKVPSKILILAVILSLVFGMMGGVSGILYIEKNPALKKFFLDPGAASTGQKITLNEDSAIIDVVKKASPAVVSIVISKDLNKIPGYGMSPLDNDPFFNFFYGNRQSQPQSSTPNVQQIGAGSGFFVSADGLILTNKHVVEDEQASYTVLTEDGKKYETRILSRDPVNDVAIVKVEVKNEPFLNLADSSNLQIGQRVVAIGNSLGQYQNTVTSGIISGIGRSITAGGQSGSESLEGVIQTDAAINPGNSGGPLLNISGQVIGINTAIDQQGQLVGFAIASNDVARALTSFQKFGKITRPFLGVRYVVINQALADDQKLSRNYGALIVRGSNSSDFAVIPGSPAAAAGLVENDIILEVNGAKIDENHTLSGRMKNFNPGDSVALKIYHNGEEKEVKVTLSEAK